jgi:hypothetical protein
MNELDADRERFLRLIRYGPFCEIEWGEVPAERAAGLMEALAAVRQFPVRQLDSVVRVVGYTW